MTKQQIARRLVLRQTCPLGAVWLHWRVPCPSHETSCFFDNGLICISKCQPDIDDARQCLGIPGMVVEQIVDAWDRDQRVKALEKMEEIGLLGEVEAFLQKKKIKEKVSG